MAAVAFDSLHYAHQLEAAGMPREQAEVVAQGLTAMLVHNFDTLVTKDYLDTRFSEQSVKMDLLAAEIGHRLSAETEGKLDRLSAEVDGKFVKSAYGKLVRHPVSGYGLALEAGLPLEVAHIIAAHSKEGEFIQRSKEAIVINHCDFIDFDIARSM